MNRTRVVTRTVAAVAAAATAAALLVGCSLVPQELRDIAGQLPTTLSAAIPDDFPSEVPLVDGTVVVATKPTTDSWAVTIAVPDQATADSASTLLTDAGFTAVPLVSGSFTNGTYVVVIASASLDIAGVGLQYLVTYGPTSGQ
ncbi:MAG: hypothetical protein DI534_11600 [Leifsonia xyli]|nr:MAG: hypothetical protein DI534_11600 [Leifsonia xyli]